MRLPVVLRPEAQAEFDKAFDWYEQQRPGLGVDFAEHVQELLDRIVETPLLYSKIFKDVRRAVLRRFPYLVLYQIEKSQILVLAIFHVKRHPSIWMSRR